MAYTTKTYKRYLFRSGALPVRGRKPDFQELLKKYIKPEFTVLDLGCGSGELALTLAAYCRQIDGVDISLEYIRTAREDKARKKVQNTSFQVADAAKLPFKKNTFDFIYSSRGPLSAGPEFMKEAVRVLKPGGWLAEETIGEKDKVRLKRIFGRGQNYPIIVTKLDSVRQLLREFGFRLVFSRYFLYYSLFPSFNAVRRILLRAPIIPDFDLSRDKAHLAKIKRLDKGEGIVLSAHRLVWVAVKK